MAHLHAAEISSTEYLEPVHVFEKSPEVIGASRLLGMSHAELAAKLGKSEGAVRVMLSRALARLADELDTASD